jgi:hypothetical protein
MLVFFLFIPSFISGHCAHDELPEEVNSILSDWVEEESNVSLTVNAAWNIGNYQHKNPFLFL